MADNSFSDIRPLAGRGRFLQGLIMASIVGQIVLIIAPAMELYFRKIEGIDPYLSDDPFILSIVVSVGLIAIALVVVAVLCIIVSLFWIVRAMGNLHRMNSPHVEMSPGWAAGWWFIPFANLFKPYQGIQQIWIGSEAAVGRPAGEPGFLGNWWACWLINIIGSNISQRLARTGEANIYEASLWIDIALVPISVAAAVYYLRIVRNITEAQSAILSSAPSPAGGVAQPAPTPVMSHDPDLQRRM